MLVFGCECAHKLEHLLRLQHYFIHNFKFIYVKKYSQPCIICQTNPLREVEHCEGRQGRCHLRQRIGQVWHSVESLQRQQLSARAGPQHQVQAQGSPRWPTRKRRTECHTSNPCVQGGTPWPREGCPCKSRMICYDEVQRGFLEDGTSVRVSKLTGTIIPKKVDPAKSPAHRHKNKVDGIKDTAPALAIQMTYKGEDFASIKAAFDQFIAEKERKEALLWFDKWYINIMDKKNDKKPSKVIEKSSTTNNQ